MGIIEKPDVNETDGLVTALQEDGDAAEQNAMFSGVVGWIEERFTKSNDIRLNDEKRWLQSYRNYRGLYGPEVQFTDHEKSRTFVKITKTKVLAAYAQIVDVLFAGSKFPIGVEAPINSKGIPDAVHFDPAAQKLDIPSPSSPRNEIKDRLGAATGKLERIDDQLQPGPGISPSSFTYEPAKESAREMQQRIHDQLDESEASKHLRNVAFEMALFGTGIIKGPFAFDKEHPAWNKDGEYEPRMETIPRVEHVSIWDLYPDPEARSMNDAEYIIQRHRLNRSQLRNLKNRPYFRGDSIEEAIDIGSNYISKYWEDALEDNEMQQDRTRFEVLEYWGVTDAETAEQADLDLPAELMERDQIQVNAWICNGQILRLVINPFTPERIPFHAVPYEVNPYSFFGVGVAENMEDTQDIMNGFMRMAVDNAALSSNLLIEIDETNLVPGQDLNVYPGKVFRRQAGAPGQAIFGTKFPNVTNECLMMFDKARQLSDESTGMPSFAHGSTGVMGVGRTASGMSMLMGAAAQNIKAVVRNIDDYLLSPLGRALFAFNMQFAFDEELAQANLYVVARGTESLMRNEVRSQRLLQFMNLASNQMTAPFVKFDYILREIAASMDLDEEKILNDPREAAIQAELLGQMQQAAGGGANAQQPADGMDPTGGGGAIVPGLAPEPGAPGFTGEGGGANSPPPPPAPEGTVQ
ncbi:MAG: hypothetical protein CMF41_01655 [Legionellales bacterium]|nr:hypothetical protein [Legionellales bacterium]OUX66031.1 MAG: hypothetical protein CBE41_00865 [Gammaproteobacteria bacterium TMED281]